MYIWESVPIRTPSGVDLTAGNLQYNTILYYTNSKLSQQAPGVYVTSGTLYFVQTLIFGWKWKLGWYQYLTSIWRWLNIGFWLHNLKTTKSQHQLTSLLDINLTLTLDGEFTLNFDHSTSQPKFNQISTSYDIVCLLCACWESTELCVTLNCTPQKAATASIIKNDNTVL